MISEYIRDPFEVVRAEQLPFGQMRANIRPGDTDRAFVFIAGFGQPGTSWSYLTDSILQDSPDTLVTIHRRLESDFGKTRVAYQTIQRQQREMIAILDWLIEEELKGKRLTLVGHSVGCMLARHALTDAKIAERTDEIVQIAPLPLRSWDFTTNLSFWKNGGLVTVPRILAALVGLTRGFLPSEATVKGLYTGPRPDADAFHSYYAALIPDSAVFLLQLLFTYNGVKEWKEIRKSWRGTNVIVGSPVDTTISFHSVENLLRYDQTNLCELFELNNETPHCIQFAPASADKQNTATLRAIFQ